MSLKFLLLLFILAATDSFAQIDPAYHYKPPVQLNDGLKIASLSEVDIDSNKIIALTNNILLGKYINIHSLLILRSNKLVYENYFAGNDSMIVFGAVDRPLVRHGLNNSFGNPIDSLHDVRSISKSIVSACMGIAISQGKIKSVDESIWNYFPEYTDLDTGLTSTITIRNLLTMTSGLDLNEKVAYGDPANTERQMNRSPDPIRYILSRQIINAPGTKWNYSGGCTELLAAIIQKASGLEIDEYAKEYLFTPLGITNFNWIRLPSTSIRKGTSSAAAGLRLSSRDMVKIGILYTNNGKWKNKQVISSEWIQQTLKFHFLTDSPDTHYGYQFWGADVTINNSPAKAFAAMGNGGQFILVIPSLDVTIVATAGNYGNAQLNWQPYEMIAKEIYPAIEVKKKK